MSRTITVGLDGSSESRAAAEWAALGVGDASTAAVDFAFEEAKRRGVPLDAVRAGRCPAHETTDHPLLAGEPARLHLEQAAKVLEAALKDAPETWSCTGARSRVPLAGCSSLPRTRPTL